MESPERSCQKTPRGGHEFPNGIFSLTLTSTQCLCRNGAQGDIRETHLAAEGHFHLSLSETFWLVRAPILFPWLHTPPRGPGVDAQFRSRPSLESVGGW